MLLLMILLINGVSSQDYSRLDFNASHGLNNGRINCLAIDHQDQLWLGTANGLLIFNGQNFEAVNSTKYEGAIPAQDIHDIKVAEDGQVFIAYDKFRISQFDPYSRNFQDLLDRSGKAIKAGVRPKLMIENSESLLIGDWRSKLVRHSLVSKQAEVIPGIDRFQDYIDSKTKEGYYISDGELKFFDPMANEHEVLATHGGLLLTEDQTGNVFSVGQQPNNLFKYDPFLKVQTEFISRSKDFPEINAVAHYDSFVWCGTSEGLEIYDSKGKKANSYFPLLSNFLENRSITAFYQDEQQGIWIAHDGGLSYFILKEQLVKSIPGLENYSITDFDRIDSTLFFICSFRKEKGFLWESKSGKLRDYEIQGLEENITNLFYSVANEKGLWLFYLNGTFQYNLSLEKLESFNPDDAFNHLQQQNKKEIIEDKEGNIIVYNYFSTFFTQIKNDGSSIDTFHIPPSQIHGKGASFTIDENNDFYLNTNSSILRRNMKTGEWNTVIPDLNEAGAKFTLFDRIYVQDSTIWNIGTQGELEKFEIGRESVKHKIYGKKEGLLSNCLDLVITEDKTSYVLTQSSLCYKTDEAELFYCLDRESGLDYIDKNAKLRLFDNTLFILSKGLQQVNLSELKKQHAAPGVQLRNLAVNNQRKSFSELLALNADENNISAEIDATGIHFSSSKFFRYRLHKDDQWNVLPIDSKSLNFSELAPNDYSLQISARTNKSDWGEITQIDLSIKPFWWRSIWGIVSIILLSSLIIYLLLRWRFQNKQELSIMQTRIAELENTALRAQMNPHFIFNSLNSIKSYIIKNNREEAADYLTSFSELIRKILSNSRDKLISLEDEIEALTLYIEIERKRLDYAFDFKLAVDSEIDLRTIEIPPLSLQPFVENAIWHGFMHKNEKGELDIDIQLRNQIVEIAISDNGVGRIESRRIEKDHSRDRSYGIVITKERIDQVLDNPKIESSVEIEDLEDSEGQTSGTRVFVRIPFKNQKK